MYKGFYDPSNSISAILDGQCSRACVDVGSGVHIQKGKTMPVPSLSKFFGLRVATLFEWFQIQSTLVILKSKGLSEMLRAVRTSTYQIKLFITPVKALLNRKVLIFLLLHENICSVFSLEASHRDASNEYRERLFSWRNKKTIMWIPAYLELWAYI